MITIIPVTSFHPLFTSMSLPLTAKEIIPVTTEIATGIKIIELNQSTIQRINTPI